MWIIIENDVEIAILQVDATGFVALIASAFEQLADPDLVNKLQVNCRVLHHRSDSCTESIKKFLGLYESLVMKNVILPHPVPKVFKKKATVSAPAIVPVTGSNPSAITHSCKISAVPHTPVPDHVPGQFPNAPRSPAPALPRQRA
ncbi:MAG: hypothetical protein MZV65_31285 [Chromatiales bacterium]|nr:hypothetical protein [Chromatiales bacterium]